MSTVTLEKAYFDTLLRRANFYATGLDLPLVDLPMVTIPRFDYDTYIETARKYEILKQVLYRGGITDETFELLVNNEQHPQEQYDATTVADETSDGGFLTQAPPSEMQSVFGQNNNTEHDKGYLRGEGYQNGNGREKVSDWSEYPEDSIDGFGFTCEKKGNNTVKKNENFTEERPKNAFALYPRQCQRTILIRNLPKAATHADIVNKISGGMLLEIRLRTDRADRTAVVSFLFEEDARHFYRHVKRNDLYICNKRVDVSWNASQFTLTPHVADRIANGATRNLVIRSVDHRHTEEAIREHAEHIHNLVVISVDFMNDSAVIRTNSVHNAMFLKTCLNSRTMYKNTKVVWGADECAVPIEPKIKPAMDKKSSGSEKSSLNPMANRFEIFKTDSTEMDSVDDDPDGLDYAFLCVPANAADAK